MVKQLLKLAPKEEKSELKKQLEELDEFYLQIVEGCCKAGYTLKEAIQKIDDCYIYFDCSDMSDVAREYFLTFEFESIPEQITDCIDFAEVGRKMAKSKRFKYIFLDCGNCIEIETTNNLIIKENETMKNTNTTKDYTVTTKVVKCNGLKFKGFMYDVTITDGTHTADFITHGENKLEFEMFSRGENEHGKVFYNNHKGGLHWNSNWGTRHGLEAQKREFIEFINSCLSVNIEYTEGEGEKTYKVA